MKAIPSIPSETLRSSLKNLLIVFPIFLLFFGNILNLHAQPGTYTVTDIGRIFAPAGTPTYQATSINDRGDVAVTVQVSGSTQLDGYLLRSGQLHAISSNLTLGGTTFINNYRVMLRTAPVTNGFDAIHSLLDILSPFNAVSTSLGGFRAIDLNDSGLILGLNDEYENILYDNGNFLNLDNLVSNLDGFSGISRDGTLIGTATEFFPQGGYETRGFAIPYGGSPLYFSHPSSNITSPLRINSNNVVLAAVDGVNDSYRFYYSEGSFISIPAPNLPNWNYWELPLLNDNSEILQTYYIGEDPYQTRVLMNYHPTTGWQNIQVSDQSWALREAYDMNNCGQIIGMAIKDEEPRTVLLSPWGTGFVFMPDPITASGVINFSDSSPAAVLDAWRTCVKLQGLDGTGYLTGEYASTEPTEGHQARAFRPDGIFDFSRSDPRFGELMAYYHTDTFTRYIHELGFSDLRNYQIRLSVNDPNIEGAANQSVAFYNHENHFIWLGTHGQNEAEDAHIIWHENAHSIIEELVEHKEFIHEEFSSIREGTADYFAVSAFAGFGPPGSEHVNDGYFSLWGATDWSGTIGARSAREINNLKTYPEDYIEIDPDNPYQDQSPMYENSEIWSGALWKIRQILGRKRTDLLILSTLDQMASSVNFEQAARRLLKVNSEYYFGEAQESLISIFRERGLIRGIVSLEADPTTIAGGNDSIGTVRLSSTAPSNGLRVRLRSDVSFIQVPGSVYILPQETSAQFTIETSAVSSTSLGKIFAEYEDSELEITLTVE